MLFLSNILIVIGLLILGWLIAAVLNYLADVLPNEPKSWRVLCPTCQTPPLWHDYLTLRKCHACGHQRNQRTWWAQIAITCGVVALWFFPPDRFGFWPILPCMIYFALVAIIDIEHHLILHVTSIVGALIVLPTGLGWNGWLSTLIGAFAGAAIMFLLFFLGELFRRGISRARKEEMTEEALGFGDVTLSAVLGLLLGWPKIGFDIVLAIVLAGLISGLYMVWMLLRKNYHPFTAIPYGPFLLLGAVVLIYLA